MREEAGHIQLEVGLLLDDVRRLDDRVGKLQTHFNQAGNDIEQIRVSTGKVIKRGEKIGDVELVDEEVSTTAEASPPELSVVGQEGQLSVVGQEGQ